MLTVEQMYDAYFAYQTDLSAWTEECAPEDELYAYAQDAQYYQESLKKYRNGKDALTKYKIAVHRERSTIKPTPIDNQIVVDAGYIATSPAYSLVSFNPR